MLCDVGKMMNQKLCSGGGKQVETGVERKDVQSKNRKKRRVKRERD